MKIDLLRNELNDLNQELAQLTDRVPLSLQYQTGDADEDTLFLYGILGGKDVGKTSLINQLAGERISVDTTVLDEGTRKAVAYCHESDLPALKKRLEADFVSRVEFATHQRNVLKNVILVDFPDYDSRFYQHRDDVKQLSRFLQGLVWVITPRKYGDHEFIDQLETVAQSHENYFIILNKVDQLDGRVELEAVRREVLSYLQEECEKRSVPIPTGDRLLLLSALHPDQYEYPRLYERLIRQHSQDEILRAKVKNLRTEFQKNIEKVNQYYMLSERVSEIDHVLEQISQSLENRFSQEYFDTISQRVLSLISIQQRISQGLFFRRIQHWPILRLIFYPFAGLVSFIGGRITYRQKDMLYETPRDILRWQGQSASTQLQSIRIEMEEHYQHLSSYIDDSPDFSKPVETRFNQLLTEYEDNVVNRISSSFSVPGKIRKSLVYLPLLWFPFLQPLLLKFAEHEEPLLSFAGFRECFILFLSLFSAGALLQSAVFLVVFYILWLVMMYAHGARRAFLAGEEEFRDLWHEQFLPALFNLLSQPYLSIRTLWSDKQAQLNEINKQAEKELKRIEKVS